VQNKYLTYQVLLKLSLSMILCTHFIFPFSCGIKSVLIIRVEEFYSKAFEDHYEVLVSYLESVAHLHIILCDHLFIIVL
jgi:hypothetical protein